MNNKTFIILTILLVASVLGLLSRGNDFATTPVTQPASLNHLVLVDSEDQKLSLSDYSKTNGIIGIFVLSKACPTCEENYFFWKKLSTRYGKHFKPISVVFGDQSILESITATGTEYPFNFYRPVDETRFRGQFGIDFKVPHTIFLKGGRIIYSKIGDITADEFFKIKKILKKGESEK